MSKRSAQQPQDAASKKAKVTPEAKKFSAIDVALRTTDLGLTAEALITITSALPLSLASPKNERHPFQEQAVAAVGDLLARIQDQKTEAITKTAAARDEVEKEKESQDAKVKEMQEDYEVKSKSCQELKTALAGVARAFQSAKVAVGEAEKSQRAVVDKIQSASKDKAAVEQLVQDMASIHERPSEISSFLKKLSNQVDVDATMITAIPCTLGKEPSARGTFDEVVMTQLNETTSKRIEELSGVQKSAEQLQAEQSATVESAQAALQKARDAQLEHARKYNDASVNATVANDALKAARKELTQITKMLNAAKTDFMNAECESELFKTDVVDAFEQLRSYESAQQECSESGSALSEPVPVAVEASA